MPSSTQSIRDIAAAQSSAAGVLQRFDTILRSQVDEPLDQACVELQHSADQVLEKLADAEIDKRGTAPANPMILFNGRLIQHIINVHPLYVHKKLTCRRMDSLFPTAQLQRQSERRHGHRMISKHVRIPALLSTRGCVSQ
jgi:hypothetical protein